MTVKPKTFSELLESFSHPMRKGANIFPSFSFGSVRAIENENGINGAAREKIQPINQGTEL